TLGSGTFVRINAGPWFPDHTSMLSSIQGLAIDGLVSPHRLYAGTFEGGVLVMTDDGTVRSASTTGLDDPVVESVAVDTGTNPHTLWAGTQVAGVFSSVDGGASWTGHGPAEEEISTLVIDGGTIFAGTGGDGIYVSSDGGGTWSNPLPDVFVLAMAA